MKVRRLRADKYVALLRLRTSSFLAVRRWRGSRLPVRGRFLVCGASGVGKSTVGDVLSACGVHTVDADDVMGRFVEPSTGKTVNPPRVREPAWYRTHPWHWSPGEVDALLGNPVRQPLFVCGRADNESDFYPRFDAVFLLRAPAPILERRLVRRRGKNHTSHPAWIAHTMEEHRRHAEQAARTKGVIVIDAGRPLFRITGEILEHAARIASGPAPDELSVAGQGPAPAAEGADRGPARAR